MQGGWGLGSGHVQGVKRSAGKGLDKTLVTLPILEGDTKSSERLS